MDGNFGFNAQQSTFDRHGAWQGYYSRPSLHGYLDFSLAFVQGVPSLVPSLLFFIAALSRIFVLKPQTNVARPGWLLAAKLVTCAALICLQASLVALWSLTAANSRIAVAVSAIGLIDSCALFALSYLEHRRSIKPSIIIGAYLWITIIMDLAEARSLFLLRERLPGTGLIAPVFASVKAVQLLLLVLEEVPKRILLPDRADGWPAESTSGPFSRCVFWWLHDVFIKGYRGSLRIDNLGTIDDQFSSRKLLDTLLKTINDAGATRKHSLLRAIWSAFELPLLWPIIPRLFMTAFSFAQPLLIKRLIFFLSEPATQSPSQAGWALVAATGLVYLGIAVSFSSHSFDLFPCNVLTIRC